MKKLTIGILAHVDAGKTTLSENMLYLAGSIRKLGRVDHQNTFLDYDSLERNKGITIFSKQANFTWLDTQITLIDTPGHTDFSAEMERTLQILDYAIMVISASDGIQAHTQTIWNLLEKYHIPVFLFINKMDLLKQDESTLFQEIKDKLNEHCFDFRKSDDEAIALSHDDYLEEYLVNNTLSLETIQNAIKGRYVFPCFFGSALKNEGIEAFLNALDHYTKEISYPDTFGARVYKITYDKQGTRLAHIKMTGGTLKVKTVIQDEKIDQIRLYSGDKYQMVEEVKAGDICALKGLNHLEAGMGLGIEEDNIKPILTSYMNYRLVLPQGIDAYKAMDQLKQLAIEDPLLHLNYHPKLKEITVQLMGEIQIEVLKNRIFERFGYLVDFEQSSILYKETIKGLVEGVGHYEPLRHYAEVHLLLEPGSPNSGLQFFSQVKEDELSLNYQRLILSHLHEKEHVGVLTGSPITDMKITLIAGRAHLKHTEGGDFREATYRAVRHGLKMAESILLEPYYTFTLTIPSTYLSRAIFDLEKMNASFKIPDDYQDQVSIEGTCAISKMQNYQNEVNGYTKGQGRLTCFFEGYYPCEQSDKIIESIGYDSEADLENPTGSVFCSHGAGFNVPYDEVTNYMHLHTPYSKKEKKVISKEVVYTSSQSEDEQLESIFARTYGPTKQRLSDRMTYEKNQEKQYVKKQLKECILVDGYNVIHAWEELRKIAEDNLEAARKRLMDILSNYQGYKKCLLIIVFDAYKVKGNLGSTTKEGNVYVVYTKEAQTADMYIERVTKELSQDYRVLVATSDALEQVIVLGKGALRMSSREFELEVRHTLKENFEEFERKNDKFHAYPLEQLKNK